MFADERRRRILELVNARGRVRVSELAHLVGVTEPTVRKDITDLDGQRLLRRTHGGALAVRPAYEANVAARADTNVAGKRAIARACLAEIKDGDAIFVDSGTTMMALAEALAPGALPRGGRAPSRSTSTSSPTPSRWPGRWPACPVSGTTSSAGSTGRWEVAWSGR